MHIYLMLFGVIELPIGPSALYCRRCRRLQGTGIIKPMLISLDNKKYIRLGIVVDLMHSKCLYLLKMFMLFFGKM